MDIFEASRCGFLDEVRSLIDDDSSLLNQRDRQVKGCSEGHHSFLPINVLQFFFFVVVVVVFCSIFTEF